MPERRAPLKDPSGFDFEKLTQMENSQLSKILTHKLVTQVTKTMNQNTAIKVEQRVAEVVLALLRKPINSIALQEELLHKYGESLRRNVRRVHELEAIIQ